MGGSCNVLFWTNWTTSLHRSAMVSWQVDCRLSTCNQHARASHSILGGLISSRSNKAVRYQMVEVEHLKRPVRPAFATFSPYWSLSSFLAAFIAATPCAFFFFLYLSGKPAFGWSWWTDGDGQGWSGCPRYCWGCTGIHAPSQAVICWLLLLLTECCVGCTGVCYPEHTWRAAPHIFRLEKLICGAEGGVRKIWVGWMHTHRVWHWVKSHEHCLWEVHWNKMNFLLHHHSLEMEACISQDMSSSLLAVQVNDPLLWLFHLGRGFEQGLPSFLPADVGPAFLH